MQPVSSKMGFELAFLLTLTNFRQNKSFFKKNLFFFNWNIIAAHCCGTLCCESNTVCSRQWNESALWLHTPRPSWTSLLPAPPSHPSGRHRARGWAPCALQQAPSSYMAVCLCQSSSPICPTLPSHPASTCLFSMSSSLFLPCKLIVCTMLLDSTYMCSCTAFFSFWLNFILYGRL